MDCLGFGILTIGLIALAIAWPPILIFYLIVGGVAILDRDNY
jgi:hypothetical protein